MYNIIKMLESYKELTENWDGYGAIKPDSTIIDRAILFVVRLKIFNIKHFPKPMIAGSGEVGLYWKIDNMYIEVDFDADGNSMFMDNKPELWGVDNFDESSIPTELLEKITLQEEQKMSTSYT